MSSRIVPYDKNARMWNNVRDGVVNSRHVNENLEIVLRPSATAPLLVALPPPPPPLPTAQRQNVLPYQQQVPAVPPVCNRAPLGEIYINVMAKELKTLENENTKLRKHVHLQEQVISGLCQLESDRHMKKQERHCREGV